MSEMKVGRKALRSDGKRWYVQRKHGSPAFLERLTQHIEKGNLTHDHNMGDVEVYRVEPGAPFYRQPRTPTQEALDDLLRDAVDEAVDEDWDALYAITRELAGLCKNHGIGREKFDGLMQAIEERAVRRTGDAGLPARMRAAMGARGRADRPIIILQQGGLEC